MSWKKYLLTSGITVGWLLEHYGMRALLACYILGTPASTLALTLWNPAKLFLESGMVESGVEISPTPLWFSGEIGKTSGLLEITLKVFQSFFFFFKVLNPIIFLGWSFYLDGQSLDINSTSWWEKIHSIHLSDLRNWCDRWENWPGREGCSINIILRNVFKST